MYTVLELESDHEAEFGIDNFCMHFQIFSRECPPDAINDGKKVVREVEKVFRKQQKGYLVM